MPTFSETISSLKNPTESRDRRLALIKQIERKTKRRLLVYVADVNKPESILNPEDKTGFSDLIEGIRDREVDFLINSPGGVAEVTEAIVSMIRARFTNVRFMIPTMAKSAGTLLVLSGDELLMDHRSELGPVDPQKFTKSMRIQPVAPCKNSRQGFSLSRYPGSG
jgi:ClpP class serine protease